MNLKEKHAQYPLSKQDRKFEQQQIIFQRSVNNMQYLTWEQVLRRVEPDNRYQVYDGANTAVYEGIEILDNLHLRVLKKGCTHLTSIQQVPGGYELPVEELWNRYKDPETGRTMVVNHDLNAWDTSHLTKPAPPGAQALEQDILAFLVEKVIQERAQERDLSDQAALDQSRPTVSLCIDTTFATRTSIGADFEGASTLAFLRGTEALDRAYGMARIALAGVDLDHHPEFRSYQTFFELGMTPPTHEQMADYIVQTLSPNHHEDQPRMTNTFLIEIESPVFQTTQPKEAQDYADEHGGNVYTWKTIGTSNWLEKGFARSDTLALIVLPVTLPETIDMPDDPPSKA